MRRRRAEPRPFSIVRLRERSRSRRPRPPRPGEWFIFLGEIPNQPGHCVVWEIGARARPGKPLFFVHVEDFEEVPTDEV